jgi:hypothetical protein
MYLDIAMPFKNVKVIKQQKKSCIHKESERLKFLNRLIKGTNVSINLKNYYYNYKQTYFKVLTAAKKMCNKKL